MAKQSRKIKKTKSTKAKVIPLQNDHVKETTLQQANAAEKDNELELAEQLYTKQLEDKAFNASVYSKLMTVYRKQKKYKEELQLINKGLKHFEDYQKEKSSAKKHSSSIKKISNSLSKSLGLTDKKGKSIFEPAPIPAWKKRKATVEKRLKKK